MFAINQVFKLGLPQTTLAVLSAAHFSKLLYSRFIFGTGLEPAEITPLLSKIRSFQRWPLVWSEAAQRKIQESSSPNNQVAAAHKLKDAALFYHYAQVVLGHDDLELKLSYQRKSQELYRRAAPHFTVPAERIEIPFQATTLPGYLRQPGEQAKALVIFLNGASTVKEEFHRLSNVFLSNGYATLAFDDPGVGEAWPRIKGIVEQEEVAKAVIDHLRQTQPSLPEKTVLFGVSLGGMKALRMAAGEPRITSVVSVSAPFDSKAYFDHLNPLIKNELAFYLGYPSPRLVKKLAFAASLEETVKRVTAPVFLASGSDDTIIPWRDGPRILDGLPWRPENRLFIYDAGHICLDCIDDVVTDVLVWQAKL